MRDADRDVPRPDDRAPPRRGRVTMFMVGANYFTVLYLAAGGAAVSARGLTGPVRLALVIVWVYLIPPLLCRLILAIFGHPAEASTPESKSYRTWWLLTQFQTIFNRFGFLEEVL